MQELVPDDSAFSRIIVRKRLNQKERFHENVPALCCFSFIFIGTYIVSFFSRSIMEICISVGVNPALTCFVLGALIPVFAVVAIQVAYRKTTNEKKVAAALEDALATGKSTNPDEDLHKLIDLHRKHKHYGEAEYYSRKLLSSLTCAAEGLPIPKNQSTDCWVTTPAYKKSWNYRMVWLFESKGRLLLTADELFFWSRKVEFKVKLEDIVSVTLERHPLWLKPIPMRYLVVRFWSGAEQHEVQLTTCAAMGTVWDVNRNVDAWHDKIRTAISQFKARQQAEQDAAWAPILALTAAGAAKGGDVPESHEDSSPE